MHLNNVLYLTDTRMLKDCIISENANYMIQSNKDMWENCKTYIDFEKIFDEKISNINKTISFLKMTEVTPKTAPKYKEPKSPMKILAG